MPIIDNIFARTVLDSRGNPTIEVEVKTESGAFGSAIVPSGASTGSREALELRDGEESSGLFGPKGVQKAVKNVQSIAKELVGIYSVTQQLDIDNHLLKLDGTPNKSRLGANVILGISMAVTRAAANFLGIELFQYIGGINAKSLPVPMLNVINGGSHASNTLDFQEFMIVPHGFATFKESVAAAHKVFHTLALILKTKGLGSLVGDEGGFAPHLYSHEEALDLLVEAIQSAGFVAATSGKEGIAIALDVAASEFFDPTTQVYTFKKLKAAAQGASVLKTEFTSSELLNYYGYLFEKYPIISVEDGFAENDWEGFKQLTKIFGQTHQIVGDDLTVTNPLYISKAKQLCAINSVLIKLNQIGSVSETLKAIEMCQKAGMTAIISHRSGESEDTFIADLAVATNSGLIKAGSLSRTDRVAKYNRLLRIEDLLADSAVFEGRAVFCNLKLQ